MARELQHAGSIHKWQLYRTGIGISSFMCFMPIVLYLINITKTFSDNRCQITKLKSCDISDDSHAAQQHVQ